MVMTFQMQHQRQNPWMKEWLRWTLLNKNLCSVKTNVKKIGRQVIEEILVKYNKRLLKYKKNSWNLTGQQPIRKQLKGWAKYLNRHITQEYMQKIKKCMKICPTLYVIRGMQVKTMRYHYTPIRMTKDANHSAKCWHGCRVTHIHCW